MSGSKGHGRSDLLRWMRSEGIREAQFLPLDFRMRNELTHVQLQQTQKRTTEKPVGVSHKAVKQVRRGILSNVCNCTVVPC